MKVASKYFLSNALLDLARFVKGLLYFRSNHEITALIGRLLSIHSFYFGLVHTSLQKPCSHWVHRGYCNACLMHQTIYRFLLYLKCHTAQYVTLQCSDMWCHPLYWGKMQHVYTSALHCTSPQVCGVVWMRIIKKTIVFYKPQGWLAFIQCGKMAVSISSLNESLM